MTSCFSHTHLQATGVVGRKSFDGVLCECKCVGVLAVAGIETPSRGSFMYPSVDGNLVSKFCAPHATVCLYHQHIASCSCLTVDTDLRDKQHQGGSTAPQHTLLTVCAICWTKEETAITLTSQINQIKHLLLTFQTSFISS